MKKLIVLSLLCIACEAVYALPVGNPSEASLFPSGIFFEGLCYDPCDPCFCWFDVWSIRTGYYGDFVFNRNLKIAGEGLNQGDTIQTTQIFTNAGYLVLNIANKLDIFGTLGASRITITTSNTSWFVGGNSEGRLNWETRFSWSAGARATLLQFKCFSIGVEGQYFQTAPDLTSYVDFSDGRYNYFNENNKMTYKEWQVGTGISYTICTISPNISVVPYADVKWAWSRFAIDNFEFIKTGTTDLFTITNLKAKKLWGYALGITATFCDRFGVTVEGRWADEKAIYANGEFRF